MVISSSFSLNVKFIIPFLIDLLHANCGNTMVCANSKRKRTSLKLEEWPYMNHFHKIKHQPNIYDVGHVQVF
ncbi:hypothetical protein L2E82_08230 [Cichorium intybus]|uniref:Uncharacterized protein n=1 Tax=Cichorium intybus TaxID=13427 RepID=A0ACB9G5P8_CICIN|nr:hypothetical protein L2E82_08230 [Cichorium intybus]